MKSDIEIAQSIPLKPIREIAESIGLSEDDIVPYGRFMAKIPLKSLESRSDVPDGKLVLVTAMSPTSMGEGKTTTTIGLGQALNRIGKRAMMAIREPSLGPCMGLKGGAAGGGYSQVLPMEDINLHFTGDFHAITSAHNLLAAVVDNHLHQRLNPEINPRHVVWKRVIDMNDRSLRSIILGLEDKGLNGVMREDGFEITAASEVMAVLCLSTGLRDLKERLSRIIVGYDYLGKPIFARDVGATGAMAALLKHAINPNLVQSVEGTPVLVHGGPFANIAHGCNTVIATRMALKLSDYTVTEAGFGVDLGAEKFFHIKCRTSGLNPSAVVLVVTWRAYVLHGMGNIRKHLDTLSRFGVPAAVSINRFLSDRDGDLMELKSRLEDLGVDAVITDCRERGGEGGLELAEKVVSLCERPSELRMLYDLNDDIRTKVETVAKNVYGASGVEFSSQALKDIRHIENMGYAGLPVCIAKTQSSLTDNPKIPGFPDEPFTIHVNSAKVSAGAGFVVISTGKILSMPGLPKSPAALSIDIDEEGNITGLF
ncbi:MAG: formate--tetrahydrofolate ligase [Desulfomonilia bacterium]|jgi:formate--tetrahydrofolate ligase|uniref:formate--tetrahydrofolate ligase n=1 Tax=anaerobic digester metagenome TaxID=1263854 RepID=A0A485LUH3_9ZZZZ|nr:formate--tetrahydrofolate ligase [Pseudomonadota bacterium]HPD21959.1 formate--tetrahydrofolate ligase [Deltaproteobacteria bacterium]HPX19184.1 formate--tetrahydrofolate ligase [Deltaproteobacteria bacterium]HRS56748.1 formate--tetrahydrofolate ligase [Desulfomonilia bacterium]HRV34691.1 formate--tetrahydrofolate ligase [Desulfomonilia bacterium]